MINTGHVRLKLNDPKWSIANKMPSVIRIIGPRIAHARLAFTIHPTGRKPRKKQVDAQKNQEQRPVTQNLIEPDNLQVVQQKDHAGARFSSGPVVGSNGAGWDAFPGQPGFRDRSTFLHPNGRLNGREFFDALSERGGSSGL